jgi:hypothetical protein
MKEFLIVDCVLISFKFTRRKCNHQIFIEKLTQHCFYYSIRVSRGTKKKYTHEAKGSKKDGTKIIINSIYLNY